MSLTKQERDCVRTDADRALYSLVQRNWPGDCWVAASLEFCVDGGAHKRPIPKPCGAFDATERNFLRILGSSSVLTRAAQTTQAHLAEPGLCPRPICRKSVGEERKQSSRHCGIHVWTIASRRQEPLGADQLLRFRVAILPQETVYPKK